MSAIAAPRVQAKPARRDDLPPCTWRERLRPYRQGELDSLCGIYAIINALRWSAGPELITARITRDLFWRLTNHAVKEQGNLGLCSGGITILHQRQLIKFAITYLSGEHRLRFGYDVLPAASLNSLGDPSASSAVTIADHEAIILNLNYTEWHWSVLQAVAGDKLKLFDSAGWRTLPRHRLTFVTSFVLRFLGRTPRKVPKRRRNQKAIAHFPREGAPA